MSSQSVTERAPFFGSRTLADDKSATCIEWRTSSSESDTEKLKKIIEVSSQEEEFIKEEIK